MKAIAKSKYILAWIENHSECHIRNDDEWWIFTIKIRFSKYHVRFTITNKFCHRFGFRQIMCYLLLPPLACQRKIFHKRPKWLHNISITSLISFPSIPIPIPIPSLILPVQCATSANTGQRNRMRKSVMRKNETERKSEYTTATEPRAWWQKKCGMRWRIWIHKRKRRYSYTKRPAAKWKWANGKRNIHTKPKSKWKYEIKRLCFVDVSVWGEPAKWNWEDKREFICESRFI